MKTALIIILAIFALIIALLFVPTYFRFEFIKDGKNKKFDVLVSYLFLKIKLNSPRKEKGKKNKKEKKPKKDTKQETSIIKKVDKGIRIFKEIEDEVIEILFYASHHAVRVKDFKVHINFGLDDAMYTGIATGAIYGVVYNIISLLNNHIGVEKCNVLVNPDFENRLLDINAKCILRVKNVHIMIMIFKVLKMYLKITKIK